MHEIGRIRQVQVQPTSLKLESSTREYYDPAPLCVVESLQLAPQGTTGITMDGNQIMDVHHTSHPFSKNSRGKNGISLGFTSHYDAMRDQFGEHLVDGCAGENILIETKNNMTLADLGSQVAIENAETGQIVYLTNLKVAAPCVEFSHYAAHSEQLPATQLKATLQFLLDGMRGFYATATGEGIVQPGDRVFVVNEEM